MMTFQTNDIAALTVHVGYEDASVEKNTAWGDPHRLPLKTYEHTDCMCQ